MTKYIYIVDRRYGINICQLEIVSETEKTYLTNGKHKDIVGFTYYIPKRIRKASNVFEFESLAEVRKHAIKILEVRIGNLEDDILGYKYLRNDLEELNILGEE